MHPFATDSDERKKVMFGITGLSVGLTWILASQIQKYQVPNLWWLEYPSIPLIFGLLYTAFDRWIWRLTILRHIGLIKVPDFSGAWKGHLITSFDEHGKKYPISMTIQQTWTHVAITLKARHSESHSLIAAILTDHERGPTLIYQYRNEPATVATETMHIHLGTCRMTLQEGDIIEGDYYTGKDRQTCGQLKVKRN